MGAVSFLGVVGLSAAVAIGVRRYQPSVVGQLARQTGVDDRVGWAAFLATAVWAPLPLLAGAETDRTVRALGDGAVRVRASNPRVVSNAEGLSTVAPDEELPEPVARFSGATTTSRTRTTARTRSASWRRISPLTTR